MVIEKVKTNHRNIIHHLARRDTGTRIRRRDLLLSGRGQKFGKRPEDYIRRIELLRKFPPKTGTKRGNNTPPAEGLMGGGPNSFLSNSGTPLN